MRPLRPIDEKEEACPTEIRDPRFLVEWISQVVIENLYLNSTLDRVYPIFYGAFAVCSHPGPSEDSSAFLEN